MEIANLKKKKKSTFSAVIILCTRTVPGSGKVSVLLRTTAQKFDLSISFLQQQKHIYRNGLVVEVYWGQDKIALGQICCFENAVKSLNDLINLSNYSVYFKMFCVNMRLDWGNQLLILVYAKFKSYQIFQYSCHHHVKSVIPVILHNPVMRVILQYVKDCLHKEKNTHRNCINNFYLYVFEQN